MSPHREDGADVIGTEQAEGDAGPGRTVSPDEPPPRSPSEGGTVPDARVSITVDEEHVAAIHGVVDALRRRGMRVEAVLEELGMVTGSAPDAAALREVEGVSAVDAELEYRLPPPDEDIQ